MEELSSKSTSNTKLLILIINLLVDSSKMLESTGESIN